MKILNWQISAQQVLKFRFLVAGFYSTAFFPTASCAKIQLANTRQIPYPAKKKTLPNPKSSFEYFLFLRTVGFFYDDEYVGEKPDERLKRSPVTSRPFSKSQSSYTNDTEYVASVLFGHVYVVETYESRIYYLLHYSVKIIPSLKPS